MIGWPAMSNSGWLCRTNRQRKEFIPVLAEGGAPHKPWKQCRGSWGEQTLGTSRDRGRKRVPRDAPPTCGKIEDQLMLLQCIESLRMALRHHLASDWRLTKMTALVAPWTSPLAFGLWGTWRDMLLWMRSDQAREDGYTRRAEESAGKDRK